MFYNLDAQSLIIVYVVVYCSQLKKLKNSKQNFEIFEFWNFAIFRDSIAQHCKQIRFINPSPNDLTEAKMRNEFVNTGGFLSRILYISVWNVPPESQKTSIYKRLVDALLKRIQ